MKAIKASGAKYVVMVAKPHDGFCLWPTKQTDYSIRQSLWKDGQGDIVTEVATAARANGLKFGVYLSRMGQQSSFFDPKNEILWRQRADATTYFLEDCDCGYVDDLLIAS